MRTLNSYELNQIRRSDFKDIIAISGLSTVSATLYSISFYFENKVLQHNIFVLGGIFGISAIFCYFHDTIEALNINLPQAQTEIDNSFLHLGK